MSRTLLAIDPGEKPGFAWFEDGVLTACAFAMLDCEGPDELAIEHPTIYPQSPVPPNDIIELAITAGRQAERYGNNAAITWYRPREWKGTRPKNIVDAHIRAVMSQREINTLDKYCATIPKSYRHNVIEAVGIGLKHLRRFR